MITKHVIGFTGSKGSGKDTAAQALINMGYQNIKFADPLKEAIRAMLRLNNIEAATIERMVEGDMKEQSHEVWCGRSTRLVMQTLGTEWGRMRIGINIWSDMWLRRVASVPYVVVTDVRFNSESLTIRSLRDKGVAVKLIRIDRHIEPGSMPLDVHISEIEMLGLPIDHRIYNDGTIEELHNQVKDYVSAII